MEDSKLYWPIGQQLVVSDWL